MAERKLHQAIAQARVVKATTNRAITDAYHTLQKEGLFQGLSRTYQPLDDEGEKQPPEDTLVQRKTSEVLAILKDNWVSLIDAVAVQDSANQTATANIEIHGEVIASDVPVTTLLWLEKQLTDMSTVLASAPVLDPAVRWDLDANTGMYKTNPIPTYRSLQRAEVLEKSPSTDKHPAQVEVIQVAKQVGTWTTVKFSTAMPEARRDELVTCCTEMLKAVRFARQEANATLAPDVNIGQSIVDAIFA